MDMPDRENVISGLWLLAHWPDGLIITDKEKWIKSCCERAIELLKEQEAVEPHLDVDEWKCGNCGHDLEQEMLDGNVLFHEQYNNCPNCGKAVKWDD